MRMNEKMKKELILASLVTLMVGVNNTVAASDPAEWDYDLNEWSSNNHGFTALGNYDTNFYGGSDWQEYSYKTGGGKSGTVLFAQNVFGAKNYTLGGHDAIFGTNNAAYEGGVAMGYKNAAGSYSVAIGYRSQAGVAARTADYILPSETNNISNTYEKSVAVGYFSASNANNATALGASSSASYENSVALGANSSTSEKNSISVGSSSNKRKIMYVADGLADSDATTFAQIKTDENGSYIKKSLTNSTTLNTEGTVGKNLTALDNAIGVVTVPKMASSGGPILQASTGKLYVLGESLNENGTLKTSVSDNLIKLDQKIGEITSNYGILSNDKTISQNLMALEAAIAKANQTLDFSNPNGTASTNGTTNGVTNGDSQGTTNSDTTKSSTTIYSNDGKPIATLTQGSVTKGDTGFVSGGQVWNEDVAVGQNVSFSSGSNVIKANDGTVLATFTKMKEVSASDNGFVSGSDLYNEVRPTDGTYVKKDSTTGANLQALDDAIINLDQKYESANMQQYNALTSDIRDVAAGAAALAALHPGTYNPDDKMSFAVGFGHYKDANAGALGAFYKPNEDTLVSVAGTVGNGDPMFNVGFSFKLGERGLPDRKYGGSADVSKALDSLQKDSAEHASKIKSLEADKNFCVKKTDAQDKKIAAQEKLINLQAKKIDAQEKKIASLEAQVAQIMKKVELSDTVKKTMTAH